MQKSFAAILCLVVLLLFTAAVGIAEQVIVQITEIGWAPVEAALNTELAARSGPQGTGYTEELGTIPMETQITVCWQEKTDAEWALVEFSYNGNLYRAYTDMSRITTEDDIPEVNFAFQQETIASDTRPYYGPGTQYAQMEEKDILAAGKVVDICCQELGFLLVEYDSPSVSGQRTRAWVPAAAIWADDVVG